MRPTPRVAGLIAGCGVLALIVPLWLAAGLAIAVLVAAAVDAWAVREPPALVRSVPAVLSRGVAVEVVVDPRGAPGGGSVRVRQAALPGLDVVPDTADGGPLHATVTGRRRGHYALPAPAAVSTGPLGLGRWYHRPGEPTEVAVYPDLPAARRLVLAVRRGALGAAGGSRRGPLGLGTEFESVRDYLPDDDIRQVNWAASERMGRPMSNQYRIEHDRDVVVLVDAGRLMAAPLGDRTRLDLALDAMTSIALVADELGDRVGVIAFDTDVRIDLRPRRAAGQAAVRATFDLQAAVVDSDYERAFQRVSGAKRAFVLVLTDLLDESAARSLSEALPVLARRHAVVVASATDPDVDALLAGAPQDPRSALSMVAALDLIASRDRAAAILRASGARVTVAAPGTLSTACVRAYIAAKSRARL
jgi:uncharacterized protein (DUF58 family)